MVASTNCPSCGSPIEFSIGTSLVAVCSNCQSLVGRGDGRLESYGKVSEISATRSPLQLGLKGRYKGSVFEIIGRTQILHSAGGSWDEWYLAFRGGDRWGWLAEAQGRLTLMFRQAPLGKVVASPEELELGDRITLPRAGGLTVVEIDEATVVAAEGELPFRPVIGEVVPYADLQGGGRKVATIDYSESPPAIFGGREVTLEQIGFADHPLVEERRSSVSAQVINCPSCAGPLKIHAPDESRRVVCRFCGALHDASEGKLRFLEELGTPMHQPTISLGATGTLNGIEFTVVGFMRRSTRSGGMSYPWCEYLLWAAGHPFHWLIESEDHWSVGKAVSAGEVDERGSGGWSRLLMRPSLADRLVYRNRGFRIFDDYRATVDTVIGEFYWKVERNDQARVVDFICPPWMCTKETSGGKGPDSVTADVDPGVDVRGPRSGQVTRRSREVNYTCTEYLPAVEVGESFSVPELRIPGFWDVAPNRPYPFKEIYAPWLIILAISFLLQTLFVVLGDRDAGDRFFTFLCFVSFPAMGVFLGHWIFEATRWQDSDHRPWWLNSEEG